MPRKPIAMATGGATGDNEDFEDYVSEIHDIEQSRGVDEKEDDYISKTPDEGEQELAWLQDAGYGHLCTNIQDGTEINDDQLSSTTSSLTRDQAVAVKKRIDTLNATIRKKQKQQPKKDVRDIFAPPEGTPAQGPAAPKVSQSVHTPGTRAGGSSPIRRRGSGKSIMKNRGGYSMTGAEKTDKDANASSGIEMLSIHTRDQSRLLPPGSHASDACRQEVKLNVKMMADGQLSPRLMHATTAFRQSGAELPNFVLTPELLGHTKTEDLGAADLIRIRSLALIELTSLFDCYNISYTRRKPGKRKNKDHGVYGVDLVTLLEHDKKLFPQLKLRVPFFYKQLLMYLEKTAVLEEGILRVPGSASRVKSLRQEVEDKVNAGLFSWDDVRPNDAAGLLKQFLRELPVPLLSFEYLEAFAQVEQISDRKQQLQALNLLVLVLPIVNRECLLALLSFLKLVVDCHENKMTAKNVAMIMAPNLFLVQSGRNRSKPLKELDFSMAAGTANIVRMLIKYQDILSTVPSFMITQMRNQNDLDCVRKSRDKSIMKVRFLGKKDRSDVHRKPQIISEGDFKEQVIRIEAPHLSTQNTAYKLDDRTTAQDILERVPKVVQSQSRAHTVAAPTAKSNFNGRPDSFGEPGRISASYLCLFEVGGNISRRRLHAETNMLALYRVNPNAKWIIETKLD